MNKTGFLRAITVCACFALAGCNSYGTDNTPKPTALQSFAPSASFDTLWTASAGSGVGKQYLKLPAAMDSGKIFTADNTGRVFAFDAKTGKRLWRTATKLAITGGPGVGNNLVVVGTHDATVVALKQDSGEKIWEASVPSEILSTPAIKNNKVIVKTIDGQLTALDAHDGKLIWHYQEDVPSLILRGASNPIITENDVITGFANGKVAAFSADTGKLHWEKQIASPTGSNAIQNMVDIDATPLVEANTVYAATYQGNVAALDLQQGKTDWQHGISTFAGIAAGPGNLFISENDSTILALNKLSGTTRWRQKELQYRGISGPVVLNHWLIVGDKEGYLHALSTKTGKAVARIKLGSGGILATPIVDGNIIYLTTTKGKVAALRLHTG